MMIMIIGHVCRGLMFGRHCAKYFKYIILFNSRRKLYNRHYYYHRHYIIKKRRLRILRNMLITGNLTETLSCLLTNSTILVICNVEWCVYNTIPNVRSLFCKYIKPLPLKGITLPTGILQGERKLMIPIFSPLLSTGLNFFKLAMKKNESKSLKKINK